MVVLENKTFTLQSSEKWNEFNFFTFEVSLLHDIKINLDFVQKINYLLCFNMKVALMPKSEMLRFLKSRTNLNKIRLLGSPD
jgi:hypothetical protein